MGQAELRIAGFPGVIARPEANGSISLRNIEGSDSVILGGDDLE